MNDEATTEAAKRVEKVDVQERPSIGSVVKLRSGGPAMTIIAQAPASLGQGYVMTAWFDGKQMLTMNAHIEALALA